MGDEQVGEDELRPRDLRDLVERVECPVVVVAEHGPVERIGRGRLGLAEGSQQCRLGEDIRELVLSVVVEDTVGVDVRDRRRPPVAEVEVPVAELLEGHRHDQVVAEDTMDRLPIGAVDGLVRERLVVEEVEVQRAHPARAAS